MSASFARAVRDGLRRHGIVVREHPGCYTRGNGQSSDYQGGVFHHTGGPPDGGFWLLVDGRADLPGPLCNSCGHGDGSVTIIAAHPANHAGAAGGSWARPFPDTRNFNRLVWGHEIMYPGSTPMTAAQYRTACILAGVICGILRRPHPEWARLHYETSVTGKWDFGTGKGHGTWFPGDRFRADIWPALMGESPQEEDVLNDDQARQLAELHGQIVAQWNNPGPVEGPGHGTPVELICQTHNITMGQIDYTTWRDGEIGPSGNHYEHTLAVRHQLDRLEAKLDQLLSSEAADTPHGEGGG